MQVDQPRRRAQMTRQPAHPIVVIFGMSGQDGTYFASPLLQKGHPVVGLRPETGAMPGAWTT